MTVPGGPSEHPPATGSEQATQVVGESPSPSVVNAVLVAGGISLAVNVLRFHGEQHHWAPSIFNTEPGGGGSPLSITWLVLLFGFWFGRALALNGHRPTSIRRALVLHLAGIGLLVGVVAGTMHFVDDWRTRGLVINAGAATCGLLGFAAWARAYLTNLVVAILARIPVVVIQYLAIEGAMDVHFAKGPPGSSPEDTLFLLTLAQTVMWPLGYSVLVGGIFAVLGAATVECRR